MARGEAALFETAWLLQKEIALFDADSKPSVWATDTMEVPGFKVQLKHGSETHRCKNAIRPLTTHYLEKMFIW